MTELILLEGLAGIFFILPMVQPLIKRLWPLAGLAFLPPLALVIILGVHFAYGFRPECIPLSIYAIVYNIKNRKAPLLAMGQADIDENPAPPILTRILPLALTLLFAMIFLPLRETSLVKDVTSLTLMDSERNEVYALRIYHREELEEGAPQSPALVLLPPAIGGIPAVDLMAQRLSQRGFTVFALSREGLEVPWVDREGKKRGFSPGKLFQGLRLHLQGMKLASVNAKGRELEAQRMGDLDFLLNYINYHRGIPGFSASNVDFSSIFVLGYYSGGAASLLLAGSPDFSARNPGVKGLIAVESPILSVLEADPPAAEDSPGDSSGFVRMRKRFSSWIGSFFPRRITRRGPLPDPALPLCLILSDNYLKPRPRDARYAALLEISRANREPSFVASMNNAGLLDYTDIILKYPLYAFFFPGARRFAGKPRESTERLTGLVSAFAASILDRETSGTDTEDSLEIRELPGERDDIRLETNGAWNSL